MLSCVVLHPQKVPQTNVFFISDVQNDIYAELKIIQEELDKETHIRQRLEKMVENQDVENNFPKKKVSSLESQLGDLRGSQSASTETISIGHTQSCHHCGRG